METIVLVKTKVGEESLSLYKFGRETGCIVHSQFEDDLRLFKDISIYGEMNRRMVIAAVVLLSYRAALMLVYFMRYRGCLPLKYYQPLKDSICDHFMSLQNKDTGINIFPQKLRHHFETEIDRFSEYIVQVLDGHQPPNSLSDYILDGLCHHYKMSLNSNDTLAKMTLSIVVGSVFVNTYKQFDQDFLSVKCEEI